MRFSDLSLGEEIANTKQYLKLLKEEKKTRIEKLPLFYVGDRIYVDPTTKSRHNGRKGVVNNATSSRLYIDFDGGNGKNQQGNIVNCWIHKEDAQKID